MPDDQTNTQPLDDSLEVEELEDEGVSQPAPSMPGGAEQPASYETQKSIDTQVAGELPPFIQQALAHAKEGHAQAQQLKTQDLSQAVKVEEEVLQELSQLAGPATKSPTPEVVTQQSKPPIIESKTIIDDEPEPVQQPTTINRMSDNLRPEVRAAVTPQPRAEAASHVESQADPGREATVSLLAAVIEKLDASKAGIDKLAVENSEEALFRMIQKDAMKLILERVREGQWDSTRSMESLAMKMGIFAIVGLFRELKNKTTNEATRQKIQQAIDYMLNENDKLDLEESQAQHASDAVQDDNYADPQGSSTTTDDTTAGTIFVSDQQNGTIQTPPTPTPVQQQIQQAASLENTVDQVA